MTQRYERKTRGQRVRTSVRNSALFKRMGTDASASAGRADSTGPKERRAINLFADPVACPFTLFYLNVRTREHRRALTRLVCSDHPLAVEQGRRTVPATVPNWRICRFCRLQGAIETEAHVLIDCSSPLLEPLREEFMAAATRVVPALLHTRRNVTSLQFLLAILSRFKLVELVAQYTWRVFTLCETEPMLWITSEAEFLALPVV